MRIASKKLSQRIINASFAFILALSTVTASLPFAFSQTASAAPVTDGPFSVESVCVDGQAELKMSLKQEGLLIGKLFYKTPYGNSGEHWLGFGDTDNWSVKTNSVATSSVSVRAEVRGGLFGLALLKEYNVTTEAINCDITAPTATVTYIANAPTNSSVVATITADEDIQDVAGWSRVNSTTLEKSYTANTTESVTITDLAGNSSVVNIAIDWIDTEKPTILINPGAPGLISGTAASIDISITDNEALDPAKNKSVWVDLYGRSNQDDKKGGKVNLSSGNGTFTVDTTSLPDGEYILRVGSVVDAVGNTSGDKTFKYFTVDNTKPTISITPNAPKTVSGVASFDVTINDAHIATDKNKDVWVELYGSPDWSNKKGQKVNLSSGTGVFTVDTNALPDGQYVLRVGSVVDAAGNYSGDKSFKYITVDNTAPTAPSIIKPTARQWFNTTPISTTWSEASDASGIDRYQVAYHYDDDHTFGGSTCEGEMINGVVLSGCRDEAGTSRNHTPGLNEEGGVTVWVRAIDNAGNVGPWSKSVHYYYDHSNPTTNIVAPTGVVGNSFTVSGDAQDNLSLNRVYVQLVNRQDNQRYGGTTISLIGEGKNAHWSKTYDASALNLPDGDYAAHVSVVDMAGNTSSAGWTDNFTVDTTAPDKPTNLKWLGEGGINAVNGFTNIQNGVLSWDATVPADVDHYVYKFWTNISGYQDDANNPWSDSYSYVVKTSDGGYVPTGFSDKQGTYFFCVEAVDQAGNNSGCSDVLEITYDATDPEVAITSPSKDQLISGDFTITGTVSDVLSGVDYVIVPVYSHATGTTVYSQYATVNTDGTWELHIPKGTLADGMYDIRATAHDNAGNSASADPRVRNIVIDNTAPVLTLADPSYTAVGNVITPIITVDNPDGLTYSWENTNEPDVVLSDHSVLTPEFTVNKDGTYSFVLTVTDLAGNETQQTFSFTYTTPVASQSSADGDTDGDGDDSSDNFTNVTFDNADDATEGEDVKGTQTTSEPEVKGVSDSNVWTLAGLAWYWWLLVLAILAFIGGLIAALRRRNQENA